MNKPLCLATLALACTAANAGWVMPAGTQVHLGGGTATMGCADVASSGTLTLGGGTVRAARDVLVTAGSSVQLDSGQIQLAQQWTNDGTVTATSGGVVRAASTGCPVVGLPGPVPLQALPTPQPVPLPGGGTAQVTISGLPSGCLVTQPATISHTAPPGTPANATFPLGLLRFTAAGLGCQNATLAVRITYPPGSLAGLAMQKHGPHGAAPRQTGWFTPPGLTVSGDTVGFTVTDNGDGDNAPQLGTIEDPFAPLLLAAPGPGAAGLQGIPTLSEWGLLLLSVLAGLTGAWRMKTHVPSVPRRPRF
ncbi:MULTISPECIES: IPTL-CTERM sorting domain-containing protein [unclassified Acidovorax]|uniref:IPTL-CTERM sorting domain-containing protein n=1 Tax=unclassified Acidovorax TaxID=2684926 RepID=UPI0028834FEC|nr:MULTISPECIES: IPTL-CTERM sorting domain-containing protein [unclassified Acidovorax]